MDDKKLQEVCLFCDPEYHDQLNQVLLKTDNFFLFAGLGPLTQGYIIIATNKCSDECRSFSDISMALLDEAVFLRGLVAEFYREAYGQEESMFF